VHDNGDESYSYLILAHKGGLLTVYGHMSEILVKERDIVFPGEIVGLSGGIPGTKGAGYLTTGAHLHFEVIKSGKHIDPLKILPLEKLATQYIPDKYKTDDEEMIEEKLKQLAKETD
jgi:murein DD-endopeptidase MepM/ murein hydrolase activator NlpD